VSWKSRVVKNDPMAVSLLKMVTDTPRLRLPPKASNTSW
jgi:hypothetical protein